ncbi:hypothetical protein Y032_0005g2412 [Ancylostoma ceylanicum]|uniref:Uncharacterized protein n=1 Tax=Ancylostoma ceylanicum TaxID=53326 RepID=A0A016VR83_9BILA|nr:hypothetical protein Y032_0005g2412 [Ancylostoma ceylanicum]
MRREPSLRGSSRSRRDSAAAMLRNRKRNPSIFLRRTVQDEESTFGNCAISHIRSVERQSSCWQRHEYIDCWRLNRSYFPSDLNAMHDIKPRHSKQIFQCN